MKTVLFWLLMLSTFSASAQISPSALPPAGGPKNYTLLLKDGAVVSGQIVRRDSINLVVRQKNGQLTYVDLELFDRVITTTGDDPQQPTGVAGNAPVDDTNALKNYLILFKDGTQVRGRIVKRDSTTLVIRMRNGEFTYADPTLLASVQDLNQLSPTNPFAPFMTLNQTAYTADPGHLYYRNVLLLYNEFNYGISRNWSVGASVVPRAWFLSDVYVPSVSFSTKVSFPLGNLARIGVMAAYQPSRTYDLYKVNEVWNLQAMASLGDTQRSVTVGYGRSSSDNDKRNRQPFFSISAMLKLSPAVSFITDNILYTNQNQYYSDVANLFSVAVRFDRPRHTFDLGMMGETYAFTFFNGGGRNPQFFPYLAYNLRIGQ